MLGLAVPAPEHLFAAICGVYSGYFSCIKVEDCPQGC